MPVMRHILNESMLHLLREILIKNERVGFKIQAKTPVVKVSRADRADFSVHDQCLASRKPSS